MIHAKSRGSFSKTSTFLKRMSKGDIFLGLEKYGPKGVAALQAATPVDSGETRDGWYYEVVKRKGYFAIHWLNSHIVEPGTIPVAVLLQYGHGTRSGAWVEGSDYINPSMRPIFDEMAAEMWKEVTK